MYHINPSFFPQTCLKFTACYQSLIAAGNIILILMSLEVMLNACGLAFIVAGAHWGIADGQIMFMFILSIAAAEVSIALGLLLQVHRRFRSLDIDQASGMRG